MKLGGILAEKRLQADENAKAEKEAVMLQQPFVLNTKQPKPKRAPLRE